VWVMAILGSTFLILVCLRGMKMAGSCSRYFVDFCKIENGTKWEIRIRWQSMEECSNFDCFNTFEHDSATVSGTCLDFRYTALEKTLSILALILEFGLKRFITSNFSY